MPRAGLDSAAVVAAGAELADEIGFTDLTMGRWPNASASAPRRCTSTSPAGRPEPPDRGPRPDRGRPTRSAPPSRASPAGTPCGRSPCAARLRDRPPRPVRRHHRLRADRPRRPDRRPRPSEGSRPFEAVLRGYDIGPDDMTHALRALRSVFHGFATLQSTAASSGPPTSTRASTGSSTSSTAACAHGHPAHPRRPLRAESSTPSISCVDVRTRTSTRRLAPGAWRRACRCPAR